MQQTSHAPLPPPIYPRGQIERQKALDVRKMSKFSYKVSSVFHSGDAVKTEQLVCDQFLSSGSFPICVEQFTSRGMWSLLGTGTASSVQWATGYQRLTSKSKCWFSRLVALILSTPVTSDVGTPNCDHVKDVCVCVLILCLGVQRRVKWFLFYLIALATPTIEYILNHYVWFLGNNFSANFHTCSARYPVCMGMTVNGSCSNF